MRARGHGLAQVCSSGTGPINNPEICGRHVGQALTSDGIEKYQSEQGQVKDGLQAVSPLPAEEFLAKPEAEAEG